MEAQAFNVVATDTGYYERLYNEGDEFTLEDHRLYSENWMRPKRNDAKAKKLIAEAVEYQAQKKGDRKDAEIRELKAQLAALQQAEQPDTEE